MERNHLLVPTVRYLSWIYGMITMWVYRTFCERRDTNPFRLLMDLVHTPMTSWLVQCSVELVEWPTNSELHQTYSNDHWLMVHLATFYFNTISHHQLRVSPLMSLHPLQARAALPQPKVVLILHLHKKYSKLPQKILQKISSLRTRLFYKRNLSIPAILLVLSLAYACSSYYLTILTRL